MKKLYALCLITLAAVLVDIAAFHASKVSAQDTSAREVHIQYIQQSIHGMDDATASVSGTVVGFSCIGEPDRCYIATVK